MFSFPCPTSEQLAKIAIIKETRLRHRQPLYNSQGGVEIREYRDAVKKLRPHWARRVTIHQYAISVCK